MGKTHRSYKNAKGPTPQLRSRNTRSSKGRLFTETDSSTIQLTTQLSLLGLYAAPTIGDGNCLFRALSDQLYGSPSKHQELRQQICDHIARYKSRYEPFVEDDRGLEVHLRAMRENATYGGHMELSAFAHMTRRNVKVIQPGLVYVIEWNAAVWEDGVGSTTAAACEQSSRRTSRSSGKSVPPTNPTEVKAEAKIKLGKGYYVYQEVPSDEEEDTTTDAKVEEVGPTVYVAYHDWEHFSSIRNLLGPHTGLPNVVETLPSSVEDLEQNMTAKEREKERDRERKKERKEKEKERKEKERERKGKEKKEKDKEAEAETSGGTLKVKLKLPPSVSASSNAGLPGPSSSSFLTPAASTTNESQPICDPSLIPLPISRSASPFIGSCSSLVGSSSSPLPPSSLGNEVYPEELPSNAHISPPEGLGDGHRHPHSHILQTPRSQYRSPKRTFDESSASGAEEDLENSKRSRRRRVGSAVWSGTGADSTADVSSVSGAVEGDVADIVVPPLPAPGSRFSSPLSSVASSVTSSVSGASSEVEVEDELELESQADDPDDEATAKLPSSPIMPGGLSKKVRQQYLHMHLHRGHHTGDKPLTRRQRKALGLPKPRKGGVGPTSLSAGRIVIPGGKWKGKGDDPEHMCASAALAGAGDGQGDEEWKRNGSGRLDVRGFRELKI